MRYGVSFMGLKFGLYPISVTAPPGKYGHWCLKQKSSFSSGNGLMLNTTWTNGDPIHWYICVTKLQCVKNTIFLDERDIQTTESVHQQIGIGMTLWISISMIPHWWLVGIVKCYWTRVCTKILQFKINFISSCFLFFIFAFWLCHRLYLISINASFY